MKNSQQFLKPILLVVFFVVAVIYIYSIADWHNNFANVPPVGRGKVAVFYAEMSESMRISDIASTEHYIYIAYSTPGVVAMYDWNGQYHCSYAFFTGTNGTLGIGCEDEMLYVHDYAGYEFVFSGTDHVAVYDSKNRLHRIGWFDSADNTTVVVDNRSVYSLDGKYIMPLPGRIQ